MSLLTTTLPVGEKFGLLTDTGGVLRGALAAESGGGPTVRVIASGTTTVALFGQVVLGPFATNPGEVPALELVVPVDTLGAGATAAPGGPTAGLSLWWAQYNSGDGLLSYLVRNDNTGADQDVQWLLIGTTP